MNVIKDTLNSIKALIFLSIICGIIYPLLVTGFAQLVFPFKANGSLIIKQNRVIGSALIGQSFTADKYFWGRPSAIGYNSISSGGSNLSQNNPQLLQAISERQTLISKANNVSINEIPIDLLTTSGSGLDPHISPAAARLQAARVATNRSISKQKINELIFKHTEKPFLNVLGEKRVNVLKLNLELDGVLND